MASKVIRTGEGSVRVEARSSIVVISIDDGKWFTLTEDQARELGNSLRAAAFMVSSQESEII